MSFWRDKKVLVTGGAGFVGAWVVEALRSAGCPAIFVPRSRDYDLTREDDCIRVLRDAQPDIVFHLAGLAGGVATVHARPADFFYQNLMMGALMLHHSCRAGVKKFVAAGSGHYPVTASLPFREECLWDGLPQPEVAPYALAKRMLHIQSTAYHRQFGFISIIGLVGNVYGPNHAFDRTSSAVVPALIRRFVEAVDDGAHSVTVWGTGQATRDFIHVRDVARGLLLSAEHYDRAEVVNIGSGTETSIRELAGMLKELTGFQGRVDWDPSQPEGPSRHCLDPGKARRELGFHPEIPLKDGLKQTVEWFKAHRDVTEAAPNAFDSMQEARRL